MIAHVLEKLPRLARVVVALLLPLVAVALVWVSVHAVRSAANSQSHWQHSVRRDLAIGGAAARLIPEISGVLSELPKMPVWQRLYKGESSAMNQAALLADVSQSLSRSGINTPTISVTPTTEMQSLAVWECQVVFEANAEQLHAFAGQLRALPRYVRVSEIVIGAPQLQTTQSNAVFAVTLRAQGYGQRPQQSSKGSGLS
jgi:Tfp pilus assembly protein PilO